jgi:hypothetical protein
MTYIIDKPHRQTDRLLFNRLSNQLFLQIECDFENQLKKRLLYQLRNPLADQLHSKIRNCEYVLRYR